MNSSMFDRWLLGAGGLIVLLVAACVLTFQNTRRLSDDAAMVAHTHQVLETLADIRAHLRDSQAVQRTYIITGGEVFPPEFAHNIEAAWNKIETVTTLTADNPDQQTAIADVKARVKEMAAFWPRTMAARKNEGFAAAQSIVISGQSDKMMSGVEALLKQMDERERHLLAERVARRADTYHTAILTGLVSGLAALAGVIAFTLLLRRHLKVRATAAALIAEQSERLRTTLASIGDAVIATDMEGRVTTLNPVAEQLTGWTSDAALGQPLGKVFRIVNEGTRQPVESPAARALREGVVVGLANHTILIARDGKERPIDDSAAPIRCKEGRIVGCVLVFRDVSERRLRERQALEQERQYRQLAERETQLLAEAAEANAKFRAFFDQGALFAGIMDVDGTIIEPNRLSYEGCGFTREQIVGKPFWEGPWWTPSADLVERIKAASAQAAAGQMFRAEMPYFVGDGSQRIADVTILPIKDEAGRVLFLAPTGVDITDRKGAEADREKFVTLVENSTDFVGMCDAQGVPFYVNRAGLKMVGLDGIEEARRTPVREFFFPEDQERIMNDFFPQVLQKGHGEVEVRFRHFKTGQALWMVYKVLALTGANGKPIAFATVSQDITQRRTLEDNLRRLADDLSDADRRKDEFLATLAHELRNPLAPIRNALQIIRLGADARTAEQARSMMERQVDQMVRLVDDLLDVSRITRGKLELRKEHILLSSVLNSAIETSRPLIDQMGHQLSVTLPPETITVDADPTRLAQVFANLLNNSAKYMDRGGHIWLTAERQGSDVLVSVKDTGIGIAADQLPHIFDMFSQVERSLERSQGGLGIGLTLVKRLVDMHGGSIEARSDGPGKGAEFTIRLPLIVTAAAVSETPRDDSASARSALRVLIVDDNRDSADSLAMLLRIQGNETRTAYDGQEGTTLADEFRPDVMLLDIGLPKLNGYDACRRIREQVWGKKVVLIAVTGWGQEGDRRRSHEAGFDHHMVKPVDPHDLAKLLAGLRQMRA